MKLATQTLIEHYCESFVKFMKLNIKANFKDMFVTHNLVDTMYFDDNTIRLYLKKDFKKGVLVEKFCIPAVRYDIKRWEEDMVIVHIPEKGSYANEVNITGGWSPKKVHTGYVENAIADAILQSYNSTKRKKRELYDRKTQIKLKGITWK